MLFCLLRKDFLLVRKYVYLVLLIVSIQPFLVLLFGDAYLSAIVFSFGALFSVIMLLQYMSLKEYQSSKAVNLMCAAPFSRRLMVLSKYTFCLLIYAAYCFIFWVDTLIEPALGPVSTEMITGTFLLVAAVAGVYLPLQYKFGYEKTKSIVVLVVMAAPIVMKVCLTSPSFLNTASSSSSDWAAMTILGMLVLAVSAFVSMRTFTRMDLA